MRRIIGCARDALNPLGLVAYIENEKPGYLQLEAWVREHARNLTPESVVAFNDEILKREMSAEMAGERPARFGIADPAFAHAVSLNDLDDWDQAHRLLTNAADPSRTS
jgi:hypothetical protein